MAVTAYAYASGHTIGDLETSVAAGIAAGQQPSGPPVALGNLFVQPMQTGTAPSSLTDMQIAIDAAATGITNLNAWAAAFATKLNADATAQNLLAAFPLTLDTNYDTNPQA